MSVFTEWNNIRIAARLASRARREKERQEQEQAESDNKIVGHHPGWANKETEREIESEFTAGQSWTHIRVGVTNNARQRLAANTVGLVSASDKAKIGSKMGTATTKAMSFMRKAIKNLAR